MRISRTIFWGLILAASICLYSGLGYSATIFKDEPPQYEKPPAFAPDRVVVAFKPGTPADSKKAAHSKAGGRVIASQAAINADLVEIPSGTVLNKIAVYKHNPNVRYAEPNYYYTLHTPPTEGTDPNVCNGGYFEEQWGLHNTGQGFLIDSDTGDPCSTTGVLDADIDWLEVWESGVRGRNSIKIAVIDTGIESTHPDLQSKIVETWVASQISEGPEDLIGHGTHVAGIAAAATNNGTGVAGVGIDAAIGSLKACKCYPDPIWCLTGICEDWDVSEAINRAVDQGYHVINMSFGGPSVSQGVADAVNNALGAGLVLVSSAGNSYTFEEPSYPAAFEGVIAVAATDHYDNLASFSNFGSWVDIAAPGVNILSSYPAAGCLGDPDCYGWLSGTSMAGPIVAGAAALVFDNIGGPEPILTSDTLRENVTNALLQNADQTGALGQNMLAWTQYGRLNIQRALSGSATNSIPIADVTNPADGDSFISGENISFAGSASDTEDGDLTASLEWTSNLDGPIGTGGSVIAVCSDGTHTITASVTDSRGNTSSESITITVGGGGGGDLSLSVNAYKVRGGQYADLTWSGANSGNVDVFRDGSYVTTVVTTEANDGAYTDSTGVKGGGSATYRVCEAGTSTCSNTVSVSW